MAKTFIVDRTKGDEEIEQAKLKVYDDVVALRQALENEEVKEGEIVGTIDDEYALENIHDEIRALQELVESALGALGHLDELLPDDASSSNLLATLNDIQDKLERLNLATTGNDYVKSVAQVNGQLQATTGSFDAAPTESSNNPVTSGGVYSAIANAASSQATALTQAVTNLTTDITTEAQARADADSNLQTQVTDNATNIATNTSDISDLTDEKISKSDLTFSLSGTTLTITKGY